MELILLAGPTGSGQSDYFSIAKFSNTSSSIFIDVFTTGGDLDGGISNKFSMPLAATTTTIQIHRLLRCRYCTVLSILISNVNGSHSYSIFGGL
ncbi:hypothetical protein RHSIM_RhsimUnG0167700 [Rhododendron simsii]|uniref:Uncharacterized protein n=1 Tax=Rhododendron simsii TaxID=118357 RepID=A0A834FVB4_RHOSS|nr:hypothetical protein RHSIM_RhsimUnG0167700 [Rhododendron simsii]